MIIDGVAASEAIDSSGEILDVRGCDISDLENGSGVLNYEHKGDKDPGSSFNDTIGAIIFARKIYGPDDCQDARQRKYWDLVKLPFIYIKAELFDDEEHPGAVAAAAAIRYYHKRGKPLLLRYSIEGATLEKEGNVLKSTMARKVALTIKPANRSCFAGVLEDEKLDLKPKVKDILAEIAEDHKKFEGPLRISSYDLECDAVVSDDDFTCTVSKGLDALRDLNKAITAGGYGGAPSTLTGGSALQREDLGRAGKIVNAAKAAVRDYDPIEHGSFRAFLKFKLPEASDAFVDRFADLVDQLGVRPNLIKQEAAVSGSAPKRKLKRKDEPKVQMGLAGISKDVPVEPIKAPADQKRFQVRTTREVGKGQGFLDPDRGILHLPNIGSFRILTGNENLPGEPSLHEALRDPTINAVHDRAMANWLIVHKLHKEGRLPDEVIAAGAHLSAMSPNTDIYTQELAYGFYQDLQQRHGLKAGESIEDPERLKQLGEEWMKLAYGFQLPEYMREHYLADENIRRKTQQKPSRNNPVTPPHWSGTGEDPWTGEKRFEPNVWVPGQQLGQQGGYGKQPGDRIDVGLHQQKLQGAMGYNEIHAGLVEALKRFRGDGRAVAGWLNSQKAESINAKLRGDKSDGLSVKGFAPKTIRYLLGMMGAGNLVVPDTHFIRHLFGMPQENVRTQPLKNFLWEARNEPLLAQIDDFYYRNHPAVPIVREKFLKNHGYDPGPDALFPAFWLHWLAIEKHEQARGWKTGTTENAGTDHRVYWHNVKRILKRYGIPEHELIKSSGFVGAHQASMSTRVAHAVREIEHLHGTTPAQFAYYAFMVPALLGSTQTMRALDKAQALLRSLRKADGVPSRELTDGPGEPSDASGPVWFKGAKVLPGRAKIHGKSPFLPHTPDSEALLVGSDDRFHYIRFPQDSTGSTYRVENMYVGNEFEILQPHQVLQSPTRIHAGVHGMPYRSESPEQIALLDGLDLQNPLRNPAHYESGISDLESSWHRSPAGVTGYVKHGAQLDGWGYTTAEREADYHVLARDFFGLGQHVPPTAAFRHPVTNDKYSIQQLIPAAEHFSATDPRHQNVLLKLGRSGQLDKIMLMNILLGNKDRHSLNYMLTPGNGPELHLIDHGYAFQDGWPDIGHYMRAYQSLEGRAGQGRLHPAAAEWLLGLDPAALKAKMMHLEVPAQFTEQSANWLRRIQMAVRRQPDLSHLEILEAPYREAA